MSTSNCRTMGKPPHLLVNRDLSLKTAMFITFVLVYHGILHCQTGVRPSSTDLWLQAILVPRTCVASPTADTLWTAFV